MPYLSQPLRDLLNGLKFRENAERRFDSPIGMYWEDEMPDAADLRWMEDSGNMWLLFMARTSVWDHKPLVQSMQRIWDEARSEAPHWALFHRLTLSAADQAAREEDARQTLRELEEMMAANPKKSPKAK
jgi:hypothetical protein